jgi:hypothetical protein
MPQSRTPMLLAVLFDLALVPGVSLAQSEELKSAFKQYAAHYGHDRYGDAELRLS